MTVIGQKQSFASVQAQKKASDSYNSGVVKGLVDSVTTAEGLKQTATSAAIGVGTGLAATAVVASAPIWGTAVVAGAGVVGTGVLIKEGYDKFEQHQQLVAKGDVKGATEAGHSIGQGITNTLQVLPEVLAVRK